MHPEDIKAEIRKRYGTVKAFESERNLGTDAVRDVLRGRKNAPAAAEIAEALELPLTTLFPGRFTNSQENKPRKRGGHRLNDPEA